MKVLIADSGSTKTEWSILQNGNVVRSVFTEGINPNQADTPAIATLLSKSELVTVQPEQIFFYGSGCGSESGRVIVREALTSVFKGAEISVESDLLGAARAMCHKERGVVAILGTGASSCLFDGAKIIEQKPSLGFILGDEGSGAVLGKMFIKKLLYGELPKNITDAFYAEFAFDRDAILRRVYREPYPNRFLAAFSEFIERHKSQAAVNEVIRENFKMLIASHLSAYTDAKKLPIHFIGSIAFHFQEELHALLQWNGYTAGNTERSPMEGLLKYHASAT